MANEYTRGQILDIIERQAQASGIPRDDFLRFAYIETGGRFDPGASNPSGAKGLFQFMPGTAAQYGIAGREFDPVHNTRAAAELYGDNRADIVRRQGRSGHDFLSGQNAPNGLDLYLAHQQGAAGYASIQTAIATGEFSRDDTRRNILNNISSRDLERITGRPHAELRGLNDRDLATTFSQYWVAKYAAISIPDRGIHADARNDVARERAAPLADGRLERGERGPDVQALQTSLNQLGFRDGQGAPLETASGIYGQRTQEAVRAFQSANQLEATGVADQRTRDAVARQLALPEQQRNPSARSQERTGELTWPAPGNDALNQADRPREGRGEFGTPRSGGRRHGGIDIQGDVGDPIVAAGGGMVVVRPNNGAAGNTVHIRHDDGTLTKYFHLDQISVRNNQRVEAGDRIGTMGRSGNTPAQGDTHLHFEMWRGNRQVDPLQHLQPGDRAAARPADRPGQDPATDGVLRHGASGASVRELQQQLNQLGYRGSDGKPLETASGVYGTQTQHAVRAFQADRGLKVDGEVGNHTRDALAGASRAPEALRHGDHGPQVHALQASLSRLGYADAEGRPLKADGVFGDRTREALVAFQRDRGLEIDGIAGLRTQAAVTDRQVPQHSGQAEGGAEAQRTLVDRMFAATKGGDDEAMRRALDDYLATPAGQRWKSDTPGESRMEEQRDPAGPAR